ncbi:GNAT family N-acetyltransferase [bacterium]|nr:GNAT family N-acetyltransferase [bacterium]
MESDLYNIYFCLSKENVCHFLENDPFKSIEEAQKELNKRSKNLSYHAITLLDSTYIGEIDTFKDESGIYEISVILDDKYWNNGYALESLIATTNYYIEKAGAYKFISYVQKENISAIKLLENAGFMKTKILKNQYIYEL